MSRQDRGPGAPARRGAEFLLRIGKITDEGADAPSLRFHFRCMAEIVVWEFESFSAQARRRFSNSGQGISHAFGNREHRASMISREKRLSHLAQAR
jgi:hypothetical protein